MTDGPHGVRTSLDGMERKIGPATSFPTGVSIASTWDPALVERIGQALGKEARGMDCDILLGPCVNIVRSPLGGRNFESYSEDPYLAGCIATAFIKGAQSQQVGTSIKHFACNNQENERFRGSSEVDERTLREIYLPAFEMAVKDAQPWTVMCSYNRINGTYASENYHLLTEILKDEWGFEGIVISDWGAVHATDQSVNAGMEIEMPGPARYFGDLLKAAVHIWKVSPDRIDEGVRRILRTIIKSGRMGDPARLVKGAVNTPEVQQLARQAAEESIVLLKNGGSLLPLDKAQVKSIAVIGPNAAEARIGGGGSSYLESPYKVSPLEGIRSLAGSAIEVAYELGCTNKPGDLTDQGESIRKAAALAARCDVAVVCAGMPTHFESEGSDRPGMDLPGPQTELIRRVAAANPHTVVVLNTGAPAAMPWLDAVQALLEAYYPGLEGGNAVARILFGEVNPSGKLTETFPKRLEDNPAYINYPGIEEVRYGEGIFVGYRYYEMKDVEPQFAFGFGLSYTNFVYRDLKLPVVIKSGETVEVSVKVTNTGNVAGKEVVQLYVRDVESRLVRPHKELKGFQKVSLWPGESQVVTFHLNSRAFSYYDPYRGGWVAEPGAFEILVGAASNDIRLQGTTSLI
jgi:beta-glucosidase